MLMASGTECRGVGNLSNSLYCVSDLQMMAYCVPQKPYDGETDSLVAMTTELGETIDIIKLLQMSWEDRLRVGVGDNYVVFYEQKK